MMPVLKEPVLITQRICHHCGDKCGDVLVYEEKNFCCDGCMTVYKLLQDNGLCGYYDLSDTPGLSAKGKFAGSQWAYLDHRDIQQQLIRYSDDKQSVVQLHLPAMHCVSCIWLLEHLNRINSGIIHSAVDFQRKEITITYEQDKISLRGIAELLSYVGYEPLIRLSGKNESRKKSINRSEILKIGIAGFCFGNSMMLSFPEYFAGGNWGDADLRFIFSRLNLVLSLPVIFFSASGFFQNAWKSLRQGWLHIDAPVALAILITFIRSVYEIISQSGAGYIDSMSGIVFFMLAGRWFQNKTYDAFSFDRTYSSYFPIGVTRLTQYGEENVPVSSIATGDRILIRNQELVPADSILCDEKAFFDFSYVTGENRLIEKKKGESVFAGGKLSGQAVILEVIQPVSQSYIVRLWNNPVFLSEKKSAPSFIHPWSRYFTIAVFIIAIATGLFWFITEPGKILSAVTAILIVACPCSLLLASSFTYGNMMRIFGKNHFYLRHPGVIEDLTKVTVLAFDKTGTLTKTISQEAVYNGKPLSNEECDFLLTSSRQSLHPLSRMIASIPWVSSANLFPIDSFTEKSGEGVLVNIYGSEIKLGSETFVRGICNNQDIKSGFQVYFSVDGDYKGYFSFKPLYRKGIAEMMSNLSKHHEIKILSGDQDHERAILQKFVGDKADLYFGQSPHDKLEKIKTWQKGNKQVLMMGDGLNDAGALRQGDIGIAVAEDTGFFSPACDAILKGEFVGSFHKLFDFAQSGKKNIRYLFLISLAYNIAGLWFAVQGSLQPVVAAVLMPSSTISIVLLSGLFTVYSAKKRGL
jgi:Cu+-exporting ATPase